ncbi:MAG: septal ring lytic transglycosylase RlpA family protein [Candidatus Saganbacteria bacterium]|nr:septal ring lytic transglycosylase RlpA family protein [Candidatus Saganbacteria bacterium]
MQKLFIAIFCVFAVFHSCSFSEEKQYYAEPARFFGPGRISGSEILINGTSIIKIYASSEAGVPSFERALRISQIINYLVEAGADIGAVEPAMIDDIPIGIVEDTPVFSVEPGDIRGTSIPPLLLAYDWSNRIRRAFDCQLLSQNLFDEIVKIEKMKGIKIEVKKKRIGEGSEVFVNDDAVMKISETDPDISSYDKARTIAQAMEEQVISGREGRDIRPETSGDRYSLNIGGKIIPVLSTGETDVGEKQLWEMTLDMVNSLRESLGAPKITEKYSPFHIFQVGYASWYGGFFHGRRTSSGERFNMYDFTAAHRTLPFGTQILVTRLDNSKSVIVRVTDRGPYIPGRILDLSRAAAQSLGMLGSGVSRVKIFVLGNTKSSKRQ